MIKNMDIWYYLFSKLKQKIGIGKEEFYIKSN